MAGATLTSALPILQDAFGDGVTNVINTHTTVLNRFPISPKKFDGNRLRENIAYAMPSFGGGFGPSASSVPDPQTSANVETYLYHAYIYDTIQIDWDLAEQSSGRHSYIEAMTQEMKRVAEYRKVDFERMLCADGSGFLAAATFVDTPNQSSWTFTVPRNDAPKFPIGTLLNFWTGSDSDAVLADNPTGLNGYEVTSVTLGSTTATITVSGSSGGVTNEPATGDNVAKYGAISADTTGSSKNAGNELPGLDGIINDDSPPLLQNTKGGWPAEDTFQGIASTNSYWQAAVISGSSQYLNIDLVEQAADEVAIHGGGSPGDIRFILAHPFQVRKYRATLYPQERYPNSGNAGSFAAGSKTSFSEDYGPMIGDKPVVKSRFCPVGRAFLVGPGIQHYDLKKWGFASLDGGMWQRERNGRPAWTATAFCYKTVGTTKRNCSGRIESLDTA